MKKSVDFFQAGQQPRYHLNNSQIRILKSDYIRFNEDYMRNDKGDYTSKIQGNFICRVLERYMNFLQESDKAGLKQKVDVFRTHKEKCDAIRSEDDPRISITKPLEKLLNEVFKSEDGYKMTDIINCLIKQFTDLPFYERERVFFLKHYETIETCISNNTMINLTTSSNKKFEVKPVKIEIDEHSLSHYLIGLSRERGSDKPFGCYSIKLSRIVECALRREESDLTNKERYEVEERIIKYGAAYINPDNASNQNKEVWLTKNGYEKLFLKAIARQRPIPVSVERSESVKEYPYILKFDCSDIQIENYFFLFGKEARVISPDNLRKKFINKFKAALDSYSHTPDEKSDR